MKTVVRIDFVVEHDETRQTLFGSESLNKGTLKLAVHKRLEEYANDSVFDDEGMKVRVIPLQTQS